MLIGEFFERNNVTDFERRELWWYLIFLRWRKTVEELMYHGSLPKGE